MFRICLNPFSALGSSLDNDRLDMIRYWATLESRWGHCWGHMGIAMDLRVYHLAVNCVSLGSIFYHCGISWDHFRVTAILHFEPPLNHPSVCFVADS